MSGRNVRVFRLEITYPEGSRLPGWVPERWESWLRSLPPLQRRQARKAGFRWPRERMFLSSSSAYERAWLLRAFGAEVEVLRSDPVTWPAHWPGRTRQRPATPCSTARTTPPGCRWHPRTRTRLPRLLPGRCTPR